MIKRPRLRFCENKRCHTHGPTNKQWRRFMLWLYHKTIDRMKKDLEIVPIEVHT